MHGLPVPMPIQKLYIVNSIIPSQALNLELTLKEKELAEKIEQNTVHENKIVIILNK